MSDRSLRGMRLGAQSLESEAGVEPAARQRVEYRTEDGEQVFVTFSVEADVPATWTSKTGKEAFLVSGEKPAETEGKPVRTHWDMLRERRSLEELEETYKIQLNKLRASRGEDVDACPAAPPCTTGPDPPWIRPRRRSGAVRLRGRGGRAGPPSARPGPTGSR